MINHLKSMALIADDDIEWEHLSEGLKRKIMVYDDHLMLTKVAFESGVFSPLHQHSNLQMTFVYKGIFEISVDNETKILKEGDVFYVKTNLLHSARCIEEGILVDIFNPYREDFIQK